MKVLLDTCAFIWLVTDNPKLSELAKEIFLDEDNEILLSAVTGFEIAVKYSLGKLHLTEPPREFVIHRMNANALTELPVSMAHALALQNMPLHHKDPFDRLLVAQSLSEPLILLTVDDKLARYGSTVRVV